MHPSLKTINHRPWPLPLGGWKWRQSWLDLAFVHYRVDAARIQQLLPKGIRLQKFDGAAWVGLVPFTMAGVMRRPFPDFPGLSSFPELNLRTYVEAGGKQGVWFFSLDAYSRLAVLGGRYGYHLPYFHSRMAHEQCDGWRSFSCVRRSGRAKFFARFRPVGEVYRAAPGTFEHWATERYCLYSNSKHGGLLRTEVHHAPWPLQRAEVEIKECTILTAAGITPIDTPPVCHFSDGVHAITFRKEKPMTPAIQGPIPM